ncbi:MFS transporter [Amylibacter sp. SFDW26]|uniref:MFS transporter n=1 Tax=Amylibacter sp. SFDW26 TaxID=2652722 RepID=UPI001261F5AD|nr:MFS transporter [Amylibacter sp. SFDW26]KAB7614576.1 MFS transporter [Amylibacter sp. SFDW26]
MSILNFIRNNSRWLFAGGVMTFATCFGQTFFISIFAKQIMETYTLTDGEWGSLYAIGTTASGLTMIWAGGLADQFRARVLVTVLLAMMSVFCIAMAFNNSVWLLPVVIFGLRLCGQGMMFHIAMVSMARWYTQTRGKAVAIASLGFSIGEAFLPLVVVILIAIIPWQAIWIAAAVLSLAFIVLLRALLKTERTPQSIAQSTQAVGMGGFHWTRMQAIKHPLFWLLVPMAMAPSTFITAVFFQQVHMAEVKGWTHSEFVALFPAYTAMAVVTSLIFGWAIDRWGSIRLMPYLLTPLAIGFVIFAIFNSLLAGLIGLLFMAIMQGGYSTVSVAFWSEVYGTKHVGSIKALTAAFMVIGSAIGPALTGQLIDIGYSFPDQMIGYAVYIMAISGLTYYAVQRFLRK